MTLVFALEKNDLILDVLRSADPARARAAMARLGAGKSESSFSSAIADAEARDVLRASTSIPISSGLEHSSPAHKIIRPQTIGQSFESTFLRPLIESLLSSGPSNAFGSGIAGSSFRGLFSEQIANHLAQSGGLGIARMIDEKVNRQDVASRIVAEVGAGRAVNS